ncbi:protein lethal(2)essential for life-like [Chironomus tepperi]|uniref:protein lethal(2)essential for life-like n=1 Tax=Chironomus tepperi TaxID=113505 RepID=UPI00391F1E5E
MRGLPEILNIIDEIQTMLDEPAKPVAPQPTYPVVLFEQHPITFRSYTHPIIRSTQRYCPLVMRKACQKDLSTKSKEQEVKDFSVAFDVSSFKPEEISVKVKDRDVIIEAKHDEREDEHGFISRQLTRKFILPDEYDPDTISTYINADGKMTIKALKPQPEIRVKERIIPIKRLSESDGQDDKEAMNAKKKKDVEESTAVEEPKEK